MPECLDYITAFQKNQYLSEIEETADSLLIEARETTDYEPLLKNLQETKDSVQVARDQLDGLKTAIWKAGVFINKINKETL